MKTVEIRALLPQDSELLSSILLKQPVEYMRFFSPFSFDADTLHTILSKKKEDQYWGFFAGDDIAGFFMLRGFDAGFDIPSYGSWINFLYKGQGLAKLALHYAEFFCKINKVGSIMFKFHPENHISKTIHLNNDCIFNKVDPATNHLVYFKKIL